MRRLISENFPKMGKEIVTQAQETHRVPNRINPRQKTKTMASGPITSCQIDGETMEIVTDFLFLGSKITSDGDCSHEIKRRFAPWEKSYDQPRQNIKFLRNYFSDKGPTHQSYGFSSSHVWM